MAIKKHDFVEVEYTGMLEDGTLFDTTMEETAKKHNQNDTKADYKPVMVCVGEKQLIPGFDEALVGKEVGKEYKIKVNPENAFGKKDAKNIRLVPMNIFKKENIMPHPGLRLNVDGSVATIMRVSGGRILVDFNHPLAGKEVIYEFKIIREVTDPKEKIQGFLKQVFSIEPKVAANDGAAEIELPGEFPEQVTNELGKKLKELIPEIKEIKFKFKKEEIAVEKTGKE